MERGGIRYPYHRDGLGSVTAITDASGPISHNLNNELLTYGDIEYEYNANGNMTRKQMRSLSGVEGAVNYIYNTANRLIRVEDELSQTVIAEYGYDPFGRRLWKEVDGVRTSFFYSDEGLVAEYDANGNEIRSYGYRPDSAGARIRCGSSRMDSITFTRTTRPFNQKSTYHANFYRSRTTRLAKTPSSSGIDI